MGWSVVVRRGAMALAALVSVALFAGSAYIWHTARGIDNAGTRLSVPISAQAGPDVDGRALNILLVGIDDRSNMTDAEVKALHVGRDGGSMATDTMMIVHVPADGSKATLISLPRDSYVAIPGLGGDGKDKLNSAYSRGFTRKQQADPKSSTDQRRAAGMDLLLQTVHDLTGLTIDHFIQVSLLGFYRLSNAIGGVPVNLCADVDDTVGYNQSQGGSGGSGFKMSAGKHVLKGVTALEFVRQRHNFPDGQEDLDRVKRQQYFLTSAFRQVAKVGVVTKLNAIKDALDTSIVADDRLQLFDLAKQMSDLSADKIVGRTIPTTPGKSNDGQDILIVDPAKVRQMIAGLINPSATSSKTPTQHPTTSAGRTTSAKPKPSGSPSGPIDAKCID